MINKYRAFALLSACLSVIAVGCSVGWTTSAISKLTGNSSVFHITKDQSSWLASTHEAGQFISPLPAGILLSTQGRVLPLITASVISLVGWVLVLVAQGIVTLYFARFLFGLAMGIVFTAVPIYVAELSPDHTRGALSTMFQASLHFGHLIEFAAGPFMNYTQLGILSLCIAGVWFLTSIFMIESPVYLVQSGQNEKARKNLKRLMTSGYGTNSEEDIIKFKSQTMNAQTLSSARRFKTLFSSLYRRKLFILCMVVVAQRFTGMSAVVAYADSTFPNTEGVPNLYTIIFGVIAFVITFASAALIDWLGRRPLGLASTAGCALSHLTTAVYFYFYPANNGSLTWVPFVSISLFSVLYSLGLGPLINTLQGELFPPSIKGVASAFGTITHAVASFIVTKLFQVIRDDGPGIYLDFAVFAGACVLSTIFVGFLLPETKRRPLTETERPD